MRWVLKIILFPISILLSVLTACLTFLLSIGTTILHLLMVFCIIGAIASFINKETATGIEALVIAFIFSPYGLPLVGASIIAFLEFLNIKIKQI
ncbi:CD1845 family protein [Helcococcus ovis]|uniref:Uncharacterized protein n=1 Tax=Helcococcus ovis TaxID=72026 RepID=A0A4R9C475_9FIRM|nr:CD1845 family protein [Helcococcus ovis]TFF64385.1 hypothetical protein EQF92_05870 [Helcococcus ovis]TFF67118.1 hypothetical protein EQF91_01815 [Helcococcus ovis]